MIADAYDAMTSTRSYRKALPQEVAFQELRDKAGTQFHPACVEALIRAIEKRGEEHGAGHEEDVALRERARSRCRLRRSRRPHRCIQRCSRMSETSCPACRRRVRARGIRRGHSIVKCTTPCRGT